MPQNFEVSPCAMVRHLHAPLDVHGKKVLPAALTTHTGHTTQTQPPPDVPGQAAYSFSQGVMVWSHAIRPSLNHRAAGIQGGMGRARNVRTKHDYWGN